jgi:hypothetical protein
VSPECRRAYDRYVQAQWGDVTDVERLAETMFNAGGRTAVEAMVTFNNLIPRFDALELQIKRIRNVLEAFQSEVPA